MKVLQETTVWATRHQPNHVYFMNDSKSKAFAYVRQGTEQVFRFKSPIGIDTRGRKFVEVPNRWEFTADDQPRGRVWKIAGSKGDIYTVSEENGTWACTCSGFKFRGKCKHVDQVRSS